MTKYHGIGANPWQNITWNTHHIVMWQGNPTRNNTCRISNISDVPVPGVLIWTVSTNTWNTHLIRLWQRNPTRNNTYRISNISDVPVPGVLIWPVSANTWNTHHFGLWQGNPTELYIPFIKEQKKVMKI